MRDHLPPPGSSGAPRPGERARVGFGCLGVVLAVVGMVCGLVVVGIFILVVSGANLVGSNK